MIQYLYMLQNDDRVSWFLVLGSMYNFPLWKKRNYLFSSPYTRLFHASSSECGYGLILLCTLYTFMTV